jgi:hypothetical protein
MPTTDAKGHTSSAPRTALGAAHTGAPRAAPQAVGGAGEPVDTGAAWAAVLARDATQDGRFVYAVRTTGVYCRPSCPSRRPRPENVVFFADARGAATAGFRACRRCRPGGGRGARLRGRPRGRARARLPRRARGRGGLARPPGAARRGEPDAPAAHVHASGGRESQAIRRCAARRPAQGRAQGRRHRQPGHLRGGLRRGEPCVRRGGGAPRDDAGRLPPRRPRGARPVRHGGHGRWVGCSSRRPRAACAP